MPIMPGGIPSGISIPSGICGAVSGFFRRSGSGQCIGQLLPARQDTGTTSMSTSGTAPGPSVSVRACGPTTYFAARKASHRTLAAI